MGQLVYIKLKSNDDQEIQKLNDILVQMKINNNFVTNEMNENWLADINGGNPAFSWMLNAGQPITINELHKFHPSETTVGLLSFDVAFGRTSQAKAKRYAKFILTNRDSIDYLQGADSFIERHKLTAEEISCIKALNKAYDEPEKLPLEEQNKPDLQGGLYLCKSFSPQPFWVIFGNVETPTFLKTRIYKDDLYNNIYRDKKGYGYLMLPLLPINNRQFDFVKEVYSQAWNMGLREAFTFIIPYIYKLEITDCDDAANDYNDMYSKEELKAKFMQVYEITNNNSQHGIGYNTSKRKFILYGSSDSDARCSILTTILRALGKNTSADIMSGITGKKYLPIEF